ncbi:protein kinase domain-containing protein [Nannocystis pusilla]|uniref:protein kinase domain-containing protein n=1 Tax=Nannocystis pusilla TaxID=889268 RepID=UPI003BF45C0F
MSAVGDTLADRFELRARLGSGGLGEVFVAHDRQTRREVAVKVLDVAPFSADKLTRLALLLRTAASVEHPAVALPRVLIGTSESPPFLAGERVAGEDLTELRRRAGPLSWQRALAIVHACTEALSALAAATGVAHRALKPGNIRVTADDEVRVLDFGIAELGVQPVPADEHGVVAEYRAPEQLAGAPGDASSDVFTLGLLLFELTTGVHPFTGPTAFKAARAVTSLRAAPRPSALAPATPLPSQVEALIVRALAPQPSQRLFKDVAEMAQHLALIRRSPGLTPRTSAAPTPSTAEDEPTQHGELPESAEDRTTIVSLPSAPDRELRLEPRSTTRPAKPASLIDRVDPPDHPGTTRLAATTAERSGTIESERTDALATNHSPARPPIDPLDELDRTEPLTPNRSQAPQTIDPLDKPDRTELLAPHRSQAPQAIDPLDRPDRTEPLTPNRSPAPRAIAPFDEPDRTGSLATDDPDAPTIARVDRTLADRTEVVPASERPTLPGDPILVDGTVADRIDRTQALPTRSQAADPTLVLPPEPSPPPRPALASRESSPAIVRSEDDDRTVFMARDVRPAAIASRPVVAASVATSAPPAARRSGVFWPVLFCLLSLGLALVALLILLRT